MSEMVRAFHWPGGGVGRASKRRVKGGEKGRRRLEWMWKKEGGEEGEGEGETVVEGAVEVVVEDGVEVEGGAIAMRRIGTFSMLG